MDEMIARAATSGRHHPMETAHATAAETLDVTNPATGEVVETVTLVCSVAPAAVAADTVISLPATGTVACTGATAAADAVESLAPAGATAWAVAGATAWGGAVAPVEAATGPLLRAR